MFTLIISESEANKNCFVKEGMIAEVIDVTYKHRDSMGSSFIRYISTIDTGSTNLYYKLKPQVYCWITVILPDLYVTIFAIENFDKWTGLLDNCMNQKIRLSYKNGDGIPCW